MYLSGILEVEGEGGGPALEVRKEGLRRKLSALKVGDIRNEDPLGDGSTYDLVTSYYCIEAISADRGEWTRLLGNLCRLVSPGGVLIMGAMRHCTSYGVFGRKFPTTFVDASDFATELPRFGFPAASTEIVIAGDVGWSEQGFDSICCIYAVKDCVPDSQ